MIAASRSIRGSATGLIPVEEASGLPDELAVRIDLAVLAQVADEIPVEARHVQTARLGECRSEREVHRAADLLVEEDVPGVPVDLVVEAEGSLAEHARAFDLEERLQVGVALGGLGPNDVAALESQPDVPNLAPLENGRKLEADLALRLRLDGAREHLAR